MEQFTNKLRGAVIAAVAAATLAPVAAIAAPTSEAPTATVSYADLNLTTPGGEAKLRDRVAHAAKSICQYDAGTRDLGQMMTQRTCVKTALASAEVQIAAAMRGDNVGTSFALNEKPVRH